MKVFYDTEPKVFEANGPGAFIYRWGIKEVEKKDDTVAGATAIPGYECNEVVVWATVTREKLTDSVIGAKWDSNYEAKLINDYNAANMGIYPDEESAKYISRYEDFINTRKAIKEQFAADCLTYNIN
jgi:hypothetical protein